MTVQELNETQLTELKQKYYNFVKFGKDINCSNEVWENIDNYVSNEEIFEEYEGFIFSSDDFVCSSDFGDVYVEY